MIAVAIKWAAVIAVSATVAFLMSLFFDLDWVGARAAVPNEVPLSTLDLATLSMTAATIALGAVALVVAVVATVGVSAIRKEASSTAKASADKEIDARLAKELDGKLETAIANRLEPVLMEMLRSAGNGGPLDAAIHAVMSARRGTGTDSSEERELSPHFDPADANVEIGEVETENER